MDRPWDPDGSRADRVIKEYEHWSLEISGRQRTLGAFFIFSRRDHERFSEMTAEEVAELLLVMREMESALARAFSPDRFNYMQLGNQLKRLHFHGFPRYAKPRTCAGMTWIDESFTDWPSHSNEQTDAEVLAEIKKMISIG